MDWWIDGLRIGGKVWIRVGELDPKLLSQPILMVGFAPAGEVVFVEVLARGAEGGDYIGIGMAIQEEAIDLLTERLREAGDFTFTASVDGGAHFFIRE